MHWPLVVVIVACTVASDVLQAYEMKRHGEIKDFHARSLARVLLAVRARPGLGLSILCMAVSFFAFLRLLQVAALSFAVPVTAVTYVGDGLFAWYVLHEQLNWERWVGILMITAGVVLISL
jgi:drug/metabolite transporter (DMT)-like permease